MVLSSSSSSHSKSLVVFRERVANSARPHRFSQNRTEQLNKRNNLISARATISKIMQPSSNTFAFPNDEHVESYRTDNPRGNPLPPALAALLSSRRPDPPGAGCSLGWIRDPPPSPNQPDDLALRTGKMQDPPSPCQKDVHSGSSAEEDSEKYSSHDYGNTNANDEDENNSTHIDDDDEEQGEGMDDTERDDEGGELWLSTASLLSSLSAATPLTLSASASFNFSMNFFAKSSRSNSRRTSIDSFDKPLTFKLRGFMMTGDDHEPVVRLNMENIQQQRKSVTAVADSSSSSAARVGDGELILGDSRGHSEFIPKTSTTPAPPTAAGTQAVEEAASMLSRWRFRVEEEEESENAGTPDNGSTSQEHGVERTPPMNPIVRTAHDYPLLEHTSERTP